MKIKVEMLAFMGNGVFREVEVQKVLLDEMIAGRATKDDFLDYVYFNGQNEFQPSETFCSVSAGDVIYLEGEKYLVGGCYGFVKLSQKQYDWYSKINNKAIVALTGKIPDDSLILET